MTNEKAIQIIKNMIHDDIAVYGNKPKLRNEALALAVKALEERPQGEWIRKVDEVGFISHICSECGVENEVEDPIDDKFCFNCGAKMKGDTSNA